MKGIKVYLYAPWYDDCFIRVYQSLTTILHKCLIFLLIFTLHFPIMLALCLMPSMTHYAHNYADIIGGSVLKTLLKCLPHDIASIASYIMKQIPGHRPRGSQTFPNLLHTFWNLILYLKSEKLV